MADKTSDPIALWQRMFGEMQKGFGSLVNQAMASSTVSKPTSSGDETSTAAPKQLADFMERYFASMNMPSRVQMAGIAEQLRAIEGQLSAIKALLQEMQTPPRVAAARPPRPSRPKRQPPPAEG